MAAVLQVKFGFCPSREFSWPSWMILVSFWMFKDRWHNFSRLWSQLNIQDMLNVYGQMCTCLQESWNRFETSLKGFAIYVQEQRNEDGWHGHGDVRVYLFILIVTYKYVLSITDILKVCTFQYKTHLKYNKMPSSCKHVGVIVRVHYPPWTGKKKVYSKRNKKVPLFSVNICRRS